MHPRKTSILSGFFAFSDAKNKGRFDRWNRQKAPLRWDVNSRKQKTNSYDGRTEEKTDCRFSFYANRFETHKRPKRLAFFISSERKKTPMDYQNEKHRAVFSEAINRMNRKKQSATVLSAMKTVLPKPKSGEIKANDLLNIFITYCVLL